MKHLDMNSNKERLMLLDKQFVFIVGSPRSGTTWLQIMLSAHPSVCTSVELTLFNQYIASWINIWNKETDDIEQGRWHKGLPFLWSQEDFFDFLADFLEKAYKKVIVANPNATHILDKNPAYAFSMDVINNFLPHARFIHLLRDGRDVVVSMIAARRDLGFGPDNAQTAASWWKRHVVEARKGKQYGDRYLEVRYEDLLTGKPDVLKAIFDFCGLPVSYGEAEAIFDAHTFEKMKRGRVMPVDGLNGRIEHYRKGKEGSWREELSPRQKLIVDETAGDLLLELGYANGNWWAESRWQAIIVPLQMARATRKHFMERSKKAIKNLLGSSLTKHIGNWLSRIK
jgi:hypothetical protein